MNEAITRVIRDSITKSFESNPKLERIYKKVRDGTATYEDAHKFAVTLANIMTEQLRGYTEEFNGDDMSKHLLEELLTKHGRLTSAVCESVQKTLNEAVDVGINPVVPPINADRVRGVVKAMDNAEDASMTFQAIEEPFKTCALSYVDEWVKTNADFQKKIGFSPVVVRKFEGPHYDTKSKKMRICTWCAKQAGTYSYGEEDTTDVFKRHLGCRCTVVYYPMHWAEGRIAALSRGEKDTDGVLWNTGKEFSQSRHAVLRRRRDQLGKEEARKILNEEWKGGRNGQAERHY